MRLVALEHIPAGTQLSIASVACVHRTLSARCVLTAMWLLPSSYHEQGQPKDERRSQLKAMYNFKCQCALCSAAYVAEADRAGTKQPSAECVLRALWVCVHTL